MNRHAQSRKHAHSRNRVLSRRRAEARNSVHSRNGAFTLVELMIVIIIIGILAGLLSVAAYNAVLAARKTRVKAEIDSLDMALQQYATDRGEVPPCLGDRIINTRQTSMMAHLRKAFPRFTPVDYNAIKTYVINNYGKTQFVQDFNIDDIDQAEALVLWLGGPPTPGDSTGNPLGSTKLLGWSANVSNPFQVNGSRASGGFAFDETRLVDRDQDGWWEYVPAVTSSAGPTPPYVYFDAPSYNYVPSIATSKPVKFYPSQLGTVPKTPKNMISQWGTAVPYMSQLPLDAMTPWSMVNPKKFQIISAGLDSIYSLEANTGPFPVDYAAYPRFPSGVNYKDGEQDNLTNFSEGALKDEIP